MDTEKIVEQEKEEVTDTPKTTEKPTTEETTETPEKDNDARSEIDEIKTLISNYTNDLSTLSGQIDTVYTEEEVDQIYQNVKYKRHKCHELKAKAEILLEKLQDDPDAKNIRDGFRQTYKNYRQAYKPISEKVVNRKEKIANDPKIQKRANILKRFSEMKKGSPILLLLKKVKSLGNRGGGNDIESEYIRSSVSEVLSDGENDERMGILESIYSSPEYQTTKEIKEDGEELYGAYEKVFTKEDDDDSPFEKILGNLKQVYDSVSGIIKLINNSKNMTGEHRSLEIATQISEALKTALDVSETIVSFIKDIPIVGSIIGVIKNSINFFVKGYEIFKATQRNKRLDEAKQKLVDKMNKRKEKYKNDDDLKNQGLYSSVHINKKGVAKVDDKELGKRESRRDNTQGLKNISAINALRANKEENKQEYYKQKELEAVQEYDEINEVEHKNSNIRRHAIIDLIQEGIDLTANIASFFPGLGDAIKYGAQALNKTISIGHKWGSRAWSKIKSLTNNDRSEENKETLRTNYANHLYAHMLEASKYLNNDGELDLADKDPKEARTFEKSFDHLETILVGSIADIPALLSCDNKDELVGALASMFSREG